MGPVFYTNRFGLRFYVERSATFDDDGRLKPGRGWFAGLIDGNDMLSGVFFSTKTQALAAIWNYKGEPTQCI